GDVAHLTGQIACHQVHGVGQIGPGAGDAFDLRLTTQFSFRADFARDARAPTVIFFDKAPLATAVVTSAMLRTWPVRFAAMRFTLSVKSAQVPATPGTWAWPPNLPSVPTSRATRVTSDAKPFSWSTMTLMV